MTSALVGYSGFVGSNLAAQHDFTDHYNSSNIAEIAGQHYDLVVFAAAKAEKWRINQDPVSDLAHITELEQTLAGFTTDQLVLISTVDVYQNPNGVDEATPIDTEGLHPYGLHRHRLEQFAATAHPRTLVLRLPGLFGPGIKKNVIFDLLHDNNVSAIHPAGSFQYYNLERLWPDIQTALQNQLQLVNLATEPLRTDELARICFGIDLPVERTEPALPTAGTPGSYDMRSHYAPLFSGQGGYLQTKAEVLNDLTQFVARERAAQ